MVTQRGENTHVIAVRGNFDDAQTGVKRIFSDEKAAAMLNEKGVVLSSANSIKLSLMGLKAALFLARSDTSG